MNIKLKFTIIILVTLIIGMAIGFEISEISIKSRFREIDRFRESRGFVGIFENIINPDLEQKPLVYSILLKYHKMIDSTSKAGITEVTKLMDSMITELKKSLKDDQVKRLEKEMERMKNGPPPPPNRGPNMDNRQGPPPFEKGGSFPGPQPGSRPPEMDRR
jgi:hypothetical protein